MRHREVARLRFTSNCRPATGWGTVGPADRARRRGLAPVSRVTQQGPTCSKQQCSRRVKAPSLTLIVHLARLRAERRLRFFRRIEGCRGGATFG
jgi:hypothetical protein